MITCAFVLLVVFQIKHFLADYPLQTPWMLGKGREDGWFLPLAAHAGVHAGLTLVISGLYLVIVDPQDVIPAWLPLPLALLDFTLHFTMDRIKASPRWLGRWQVLSSRDFARLPSLRQSRGWRHLRGGGITNNGAIIADELLSSNTYFWWALGLDQMVHHLTHYVIIFVLITRGTP